MDFGQPSQAAEMNFDFGNEQAVNPASSVAEPLQQPAGPAPESDHPDAPDEPAEPTPDALEAEINVS